MAEHSEHPEKSWQLAEGDEVAPGRLALKRLGRGHLYETYLAWDDRLFSIVVAKIVRPDLVEDSDAISSLTSEAEALRRLQHPMLVRSFGSVLDGPKPHLILEHLEGPTLRTLVKKHAPLPLEQILPLALDLSSALHYLEVEGWLHLDVKPANVIMAPAPKLVDLSIARTIEDAQDMGAGVGTEGYMAPEQVEGTSGAIGPATDIWGLGITIYEALTGHRPRSEDVETMELYEEPLPLPDEVPREVSEMLMRCLDPDPSKRPRAANVAMALAPAVQGIDSRRVIRRGRPRIR